MKARIHLSNVVPIQTRMPSAQAMQYRTKVKKKETKAKHISCTGSLIFAIETGMVALCIACVFKKEPFSNDNFVTMYS